MFQSKKNLTVKELEKLDHSHLLSLDDIYEMEVLLNTDNSQFNKDKTKYYSNSPILLPKNITDNFEGYKLPFNYYKDSILQYYLLAQIKGYGDINAPSNSIPTNRHYYNTKLFFENVEEGLLLDVGCDKPSVSHLVYPKGINYIGIDPSFSNNEDKIIGMAEFLPFKDSSFNYVSFNTSLDHILDYHSAINEAKRVLKSDGSIFIISYCWKNNLSLLKDTVHFHHYKENQLTDTLIGDFEIQKIQRFEDIKGEDHRFVIFIQAKKF
jgi:SAM-dependent methyltransferase